LDLEILHEDIAVVPLRKKWQLPAKPNNQAEWAARDSLCIPVLQKFLPDIIAAAASHNAERLWQIACHLASSMLDTICMSETQTNFGRGEIPIFSCVHVLISLVPVKIRSFVLVRDLLTKVQVAENNRDVLLRDPFRLLESSICRQCRTAGLPMPELPVRDYDHLLSVAETLVQTAQAHAERAATARQQAALGR